uniref:Uncharacterized protein n=1 Tax=Panagrolaimus superbus TaxID=310955 RepID=A0A914Y4B9_9BILA
MSLLGSPPRESLGSPPRESPEAFSVLGSALDDPANYDFGHSADKKSLLGPYDDFPKPKLGSSKLNIDFNDPSFEAMVQIQIQMANKLYFSEKKDETSSQNQPTYSQDIIAKQSSSKHGLDGPTSLSRYQQNDQPWFKLNSKPTQSVKIGWNKADYETTKPVSCNSESENVYNEALSSQRGSQSGYSGSYRNFSKKPHHNINNSGGFNAYGNRNQRFGISDRVYNRRGRGVGASSTFITEDLPEKFANGEDVPRKFGKSEESFRKFGKKRHFRSNNFGRGNYQKFSGSDRYRFSRPSPRSLSPACCRSELSSLGSRSRSRSPIK